MSQRVAQKFFKRKYCSTSLKLVRSYHTFKRKSRKPCSPALFRFHQQMSGGFRQLKIDELDLTLIQIKASLIQQMLYGYTKYLLQT
ncbi:MAG: hypothetical protein DPW09_26175 [Anaerolineae bacterium]|nr:hypothetical protein [Anaerolineae bacterium]